MSQDKNTLMSSITNAPRNTISRCFLKSFVEILADLSLPANHLCVKADISKEDIESSLGHLAENKFYDLIQHLKETPYPENLALKIGDRLIMPSLGVLGFSLMTADSLKDVYIRAIKYQHYISTSFDLSIKEKDGNIDLEFTIVGIQTDVTHFIMDMILASAVKNIRWQLVNSDLKPLACKLKKDKPGNIEEYSKYFGCQVEFGQDVNALTIPKAVFEQKNPCRNATLDKINNYELDIQLGGSCENSLIRELKEKIRDLLPTGNIAMGPIAKEFSISSRTLLRRLKENGYTFSELVDITRKGQAKRYLLTTEKTFQDISYALGYKDPSTFYRSFKRWYAVSPSQYKKNLMESSASISKDTLDIFDKCEQYL